MRRGSVGPCWLGPGCPVFRTDTRENPVGKNGVMTPAPLVSLKEDLCVLRDLVLGSLDSTLLECSFKSSSRSPEIWAKA
jgi:hypothetical protein